MHYPEEVLTLLDELIDYSNKEQVIQGILLVGSFATGDFSHSEDIDLVILTKDPQSLIKNNEWVDQFGIVQNKSTGSFGPIQGLKVKYADKEVDFGITSLEWTSITPLSEDTKRIIKKGAKIIFDPQEYFKNLLEKMY